MGKTIEHADGSPVKMKKKSKKNKEVTDDLLPLGDDDSHVETDGDHLKKKKRVKDMEKKRYSESKEDGEADGERLKKKKTDKHRDKMEKSESKEDGETDGDQSKKKKKDKHRETMENSESKEDRETDSDHLKKKKKDKHREKTGKSESKEGGDEDQHDKGNDSNDDLQKKKKRKRNHSAEKLQVKENERDQNAGSDVEKDCDPKPEKKKKDVVKDGSEDTSKKSDRKKKTKKDGQQKTNKSVEKNTEKPKAKSKSKRVSFSGHVEVFPTSDTQLEEQTTGDGLVRGKRFTPEEDKIVKQAVLDYIAAHGLGEEGLKKVLNCKSHKGMNKCWQEIGLCLPHRPQAAIYYRAHILFERGESRSWTQEEFDLLKEFHEKYGNDWKKIADELGKHRFHVKDAWRRIKFENLKAGRWTQEEYQNLYDLVNFDLQMKVNGEEKRKSKHGMLRDNIPWTAISEKLSTRTDATCCMKWYNQLTSSLVLEKKWSDADDYRMIGALYELDAACVEDVDWDNLLEHRPGDICLKRWKQMVKHIGDYGSKPFGEQVDILAKRYCPDLAETREVWDNRPTIP